MKDNVDNILKNFDKNAFQVALISWFKAEMRDLPWRKDKDPYKVWVSEVMLQQTRVDTVIPYFNRFIEKYPDVESLAKADEQELLKMWEGLGYYSRVKNLHSAVKEVQERYGGVIPDDEKKFRELKGVGPYTAGAVLSIAYNKPVPAVDGNVMRVISRIFNLTDDISKTATRRKIEKVVSEIISVKDPSSFNQGMMELGALVCTPRNPSCLLCPVREYCRAFHAGTERDLPVKTKQKKGKKIDYIAVVLKDQTGKILIRKRPDEGLLASLWEFPMIEAEKLSKNVLPALEKQFFNKYGAEIRIDKPLCMVEHVFSHLSWRIQAYQGTYTGEIEENSRLKAVPTEKVETYPFPVPFQKIWQAYKEEGSN